MPENQTHDIEERRKRSALAESERKPAASTEVWSGSLESVSMSTLLLRGSSLSERSNSPIRTEAIQKAQRTHGNRAVQRYLSVQRCGDTPCGCSSEERTRHALEHRFEGVGAMASTATSRDVDPEPAVQRMFAVQRQPGHTPAPADPNYTNTTPGDAYVGPGGGAGIGGLVSYGCYCGPGGDAITGSRCGPGAAPKDAIDAQCMRHDSDYNKAGVDSGSTPGTVNMFTDLQGWLKSEEADRRLADSVDAQMDANPGAFSPSARLYGQGIKGIFGGRANLSHAANWGIGKYGEASEGLTGAYDDAAGFVSNSASEAEKGVTDFIKSAAGWNSASDVAGGVAGGAADAANWLGKTGSAAFSGIGSALGSAGSWLGNTLGSAAGGLGDAALGIGAWGLDTAGAVGDVAIDLAGRGAHAIGETAGDVADWGVKQAKGAWDDLTSLW
jgi:hypothetical protein